MNQDLLPADQRTGWWILAINTFAFTICFAAWMMNGVLVTFLVDNGVYSWGPSEMGWLIGIPVLTGALFRLPLGIATDKWGGRAVFGTVIAVFRSADVFSQLLPDLLAVLYCRSCFGLCGSSFAVGIAYTSVWFPMHRQGTALGIFGAGNAGAALTSLGAPHVLNWLTSQGEHLDAGERCRNSTQPYY